MNNHLEPLAAIYPKNSHRIALEGLRLSNLAAREFAETCLRDDMVRSYQVSVADMHCLANWNSPGDVFKSPIGS